MVSAKSLFIVYVLSVAPCCWLAIHHPRQWLRPHHVGFSPGGMIEQDTALSGEWELNNRIAPQFIINLATVPP